MLNEALDSLDAATRWLRSRIRVLVVVLLLAGWSVGWGAVGLLTTLLGYPQVAQVSVAALLLPFIALTLRTLRRRRDRRRRAAHELVARAWVHQMPLNGPMRSTLRAFDHLHAESLRLLRDPTLTGALAHADVDGTLRRTSEELWSLASQHARTGQQLRELKRGGRHPLVAQAQQRARDTHARQRAHAEALVDDVQRLVDQLYDLQAEASAPSRGALPTQVRLQETAAHLDRRARALGEIRSLEQDASG